MRSSLFCLHIVLWFWMKKLMNGYLHKIENLEVNLKSRGSGFFALWPVLFFYVTFSPLLTFSADDFQESLSTIFSLYIRDMGVGGDNVDAGWLGRQGIALALHSAADVLRTKDLPVVMTFLISRALVIVNDIFLLSLCWGLTF